jgi:site-specific DNA-methyltransferase (adenine-specific)
MKQRAKLELSNEDNIKLMARYPDRYFDLAIVDPPYGIEVNESIGRRKGMKHSGNKKILWDNEIPKDSYFKELFRISKNQIIWGGNYFYLPPTKCFIIWDKKYSQDVSFSRYEYAWASFNKTSKGFEFNGQANKGKIHPTQKPASLYEFCLDTYAKEGDKILDTHLGSGSIAIACQNRGFDLTACELDKEYFEAATKRIEAATAQTNIFDYI